MAPQPLRGSIRVPGDKSLSHRVALFSALAEGTSRVRGLLDSLDVRSTLAAISALGARVELDAEGCASDVDRRSDRGTFLLSTPRVDNRNVPLSLLGVDNRNVPLSTSSSPEAEGSGGLSGAITGWGAAGPRPPGGPLDCGNSGTTARLLLGILSGHDIAVSLAGDESLSRRPMSRVTLPLTQMGARFSPASVPGRSCAGRSSDTLPLTVHGTAALRAIDYQSPVASAQVKSAVLLAGLNARGTTSVTEPCKSRDHTELLLPAYGVELEVGGLTVSIPGGQRLRASDCEVPGDPSSAAFPLVAAALIPMSEVTVRGMLLNPTRTGFLSVMRRMGADIAIEISNNSALGGEQVGDVTLRYREGLVATEVEAHEVPSLIDELPILALLATAAQGTTVFRQVGELRVKESDRLAAIVCGLTALGCDAHDEGDSLSVGFAPPRIGDVSLETHDDHRLAMTWAIAARAFDLAPCIHGLESVKVSYPGFFDDLKRLS